MNINFKKKSYFLFLAAFLFSIESFAQSSSGPIGCDTAALEQAKAITRAMNQLSTATAQANITQPTDVAIATCGDQYIDQQSSLNVITNSEQPNRSDIFGPLIETPFMASLGSSFNGVLEGSAQQFINVAYQENVENYASAAMDSAQNYLEQTSFGQTLSGIGSVVSGAMDSLNSVLEGAESAATEAPCEMTEKSWLIANCIETPQIPSLSELISNNIEVPNISDRLGDSLGGILSKCEPLKDMLGDYSNNILADLEAAQQAQEQESSIDIEQSRSCFDEANDYFASRPEATQAERTSWYDQCVAAGSV